MIFESSLAAVNPIQLAMDTGALRTYPRFRAPIPPVARPHLLTDQLRGCSCDSMGRHSRNFKSLPPDYGSLRGMGQTTYTGDPGTFDINALQVPSAGSGNISVLQNIAIGANFIPGIGQIASLAITTFKADLNQFEAWFNIGAGRREADIIVPVQNNLMAALGGVTSQISTGQSPDVNTLLNLYRQVWQLGVAFMEFVLQRQFTDRRASGQALNTVMQYIDGTCGYSVPVGYTANPSQFNCLRWGDNTVGGPGTNGMLGSIGRAITALGGTVQALPNLENAANQGIPPASVPLPGPAGLPTTILGINTSLVLVGVGAFFLLKRGARRG